MPSEYPLAGHPPRVAFTQGLLGYQRKSWSPTERLPAHQAPDYPAAHCLIAIPLPPAMAASKMGMLSDDNARSVV